jgi:hypothetical protein
VQARATGSGVITIYTAVLAEGQGGAAAVSALFKYPAVS